MDPEISHGTRSSTSSTSSSDSNTSVQSSSVERVESQLPEEDCIRGVFSPTKFTLYAARGAGPWGPCGTFTGYGEVQVCSSCVNFILSPTAAGMPRRISLSLSSIRRGGIRVATPLLGGRHVYGTAIWCAQGGLQMTRIEFRIEVLAAISTSIEDALVRCIIHAATCPERARKERKRKRMIEDQTLVKTDVHLAYVDPAYPFTLFLATQLAHTAV